MHHFHYRRGELYCEQVPIRRIAAAIGTPAYIYSYATFTRHYDVFDQAFAGLPHLICFAMKANSNLAILRTIVERGGGVDIVTGGELFRALTACVPPERIVFSGVGKSDAEIEYALKNRILMFNVESAAELAAIEAVAGRLRQRAPIAIRVNPNIDPKTHPYISTGLKQSKFGVERREATRLYQKARRSRSLQVKGVSCHIGSQITELKPFVEAVTRMAAFTETLQKQGYPIECLDIGGGLGIPYKDETPPEPKAYGRALTEPLRKLKVTILLEPGRVIAGNAGIFVTRVLYQKAQGRKKFAVVDGAMNDLLRPALYGSYHEIWPVRKKTGRKTKVDVVGPICESGDFLAKDRPLPALRRGDLIVCLSAGAYGFTMASQYNSRPRAAEILVSGKEFYIVRQREEYKDLPKGEHVPHFLMEGNAR